ncbi:Oxidant-induced cell-cycle arrest protein 5 [Spathaspora sp. JA1]|nr:Oxidant-induced cell-cycle arrest protein 5 [Spathaspora sp. JA1]
MTESCKSSNRSSSTSSPIESPVLSTTTTTEEDFEEGEDISAILGSKYLEQKQKQAKQIQVEDDRKPSFNYNLEIFNLCKEYLNTKNHHGLALVARQKGIPPFLRFKVWPILLKYHPFVLNPFIQPDTEIVKDANRNRTSNSNTKNTNENGNGSESSTTNLETSSGEPASDDKNDIIKHQVRRDLSKYIQRLKYSNTKYTLSELEHEILRTLEHSIMKFSRKWGKIIKYDEALTWIALNLAEWFPPIPKTPWVLMGRDHSSPNNLLTVNLLDDYSNYIDNIPELREYLEELIYKDERISQMSFHEVYERLVLVLLHCPEPNSKKKRGQELTLLKKNQASKEQKRDSKEEESTKLNKTTLPITGGTIEERVSYFIYCLRKLLPELSQFFQEEQVLTKFGTSDDEWIIWWLKFCGSKVWSRYDRGRIWDLLLGWRLKNPKKDFNYYYEKLNYVNRNTLEQLGPDIFWSLTNEEENFKENGSDDNKPVLRQNSFRNLVDELTLSQTVVTKPVDSQETTTSSSSSIAPSISIPFSKLDPHISLIFISLAFLKSRENNLVELDQHEIRQLLSRLPSKAYKYKSKKKNANSHQHQQGSSRSSSSSNSPVSSPVHDDSNDLSNSIIISNDSAENHKVNYIDNIIQEAGELWRKWLWVEMIDDN